MTYLIILVFAIGFAFIIFFAVRRTAQVYGDPKLQKHPVPDLRRGRKALTPEVLPSGSLTSSGSRNGDDDLEGFNTFILELLNSLSGVPASEGLIRGRIEHMKARARKKEDIKTLKLVEEHMDLVTKTLQRAGDAKEAYKRLRNLFKEDAEPIKQVEPLRQKRDGMEFGYGDDESIKYK